MYIVTLTYSGYVVMSRECKTMAVARATVAWIVELQAGAGYTIDCHTVHLDSDTHLVVTMGNGEQTVVIKITEVW